MTLRKKVVLVRTPLRLEFLGGSTDMASFYTRSTGRVLNAAINKYIYVFARWIPEPEVRFFYEKPVVVSSANKLPHPRTKTALLEAGIKNHIEIVSLADLPGSGGLGSSSSYSVAIISALRALQGKPEIAPRALAEDASRLEIDLLHEPIGKQDQYGAACGGINYLIFQKNGFVQRKEVRLSKRQEANFYKHFLVFNTGHGHSATQILGSQKKKDGENFAHLKQMAALVPSAIRALEDNDLKVFAQILEVEWTIKKNLTAGVSTPHLETMYAKAKQAGAWGGRVSGAGGGGFMFFLAPPKTHQKIRKALKGFHEEVFRFVSGGSRILFRN